LVAVSTDDPSQFIVQVDPLASPAAVVLRVRGEIDALTGPELRAGIARQAVRGAGPLILDLDGVTFIGSPALAVLIDAAKTDPGPAGRVRECVSPADLGSRRTVALASGQPLPAVRARR
jgi:anti-anti-sigma factor